jgi:hypothetical protein
VVVNFVDIGGIVDHHCLNFLFVSLKGWSYGSWIYNYLCNQCISPVSTKVVISNPVHGEMYSIQHNVIKFVGDLR